MTTWNTRSLNFTQFNYCTNLGYDVLTLTELWGKTNKFADDTIRWIYGEDVIEFTVTKPKTITSITTVITDPSGELSNLSPA